MRQRKVGPSSAARAKAVAAKRANQAQRVDALRQLLAETEIKLTAGALRPEEVTHEFICAQAGLSRATYWRFLKANAELREKAIALAWTTARRSQRASGDDRLISPRRTIETPHDAVKRLEEEKLITEHANRHLKRQLAAAKTLVGLLELDLRAKTQEAESKDFLLAATRETSLTIAAKLKEVVEICRTHGIPVDVELSAFVLPRSAPPAASRKPDPSRAKRGPTLTVVEQEKS